MFPIHDNNASRTTPYINYGLIGLNILVFLHEVNLSDRQLEHFLYLYALIPGELTINPYGEWITLITSQFLHGGWLHIGSNMLYLWIFGNNVEARLGHFKYLIFYLTCGVFAALCEWFVDRYSGVPSLGASGAIAGVLGAYLIWFPNARITTLVFLGFFVTTISIPALILIGIFFIQNLVSGIASLQAAAHMSVEAGGIAYWAHIGGFGLGMFFALLLTGIRHGRW